MPRLLLAITLALWALSASSIAHAHQSSFTYGQLRVDEDEKTASYELLISTGDLFEALALPEDRPASPDELLSGAARLEAYVWKRVQLSGNQGRCELSSQGVDLVDRGRPFARLRARLHCPEGLETLRLDYQLFFDLDPLHQGLLTTPGGLTNFSSSAREPFVLTLGHESPGSVGGFLRSGIDHVLFGLDHILFLVALLLVAFIGQTKSEATMRGLGESLRYTALIVTAFTLGHTLTLIPAALGIVQLPSALVESIIALSIVYVALEDLVYIAPPRRPLVTLLFGLMHGLGFASMLRPLLPPEDLLLPLLLFNLGVEVGQLLVVLLALPLLVLVGRLLGISAYRRRFLPLAVFVLALFGLNWFVERAFGLSFGVL